MARLIPMGVYPCSKEIYFKHNKALRNDKKADINILKDDIDDIQERFYDNFQGEDFYDLRGYEPVIGYKKMMDDLILIDYPEYQGVTFYFSNPIITVDDSPYYAGATLLEASNNHLTFYILKNTTEYSLYKVSNHKKDICQKWQNILYAVANNIRLADYNIKIKIAHLADFDNSIIISDLDEDKFTAKYIANNVPTIYEGLEDEPCQTYSRKCSKCEYSRHCDLPEFSILDFDLRNNNWRKIDKFIKNYGDLSISNLQDDDVTSLGEMNSMRFAVHNREDLESLVNEEVVTEFLDKIKDGGWHYDFETYSSLYHQDFYKRNMQVPYSYSLHQTDGDNNILNHHTYIVSPDSKDLSSLVKDLFTGDSTKEFINSNLPIVVFHEEFERGRFKEMAEAYPQYEEQVNNILDRIIDLEKVFLNAGYVQKGMNSNSLKVLVPVLLGEDKYSKLNIGDGSTAAYEYKKMFDNNIVYEEQMQDQIDYVTEDTLNQVLITDKLRELVNYSK